MLLLVDLLVVHRKAHVTSTKEAAIESAVWIAIGLAFGLVVLAMHGAPAAGEYYAGYLIEQSLSVDNVFVWAVILRYFVVPAQYQFRVLFWGIFGALVLRAIFIFAGVALIEKFSMDPLRLRRVPALHRRRLIAHKDERGRTRNGTRCSSWCSASSRRRPSTTVSSSSRASTGDASRRRCSRCWC